MRMARGGRPAGAAAAAHEEALPAAPFYGRISCAQCRRRLGCTCSAHTVALLLVLAVVSTEYRTRIELVGKTIAMRMVRGGRPVAPFHASLMEAASTLPWFENITMLRTELNCMPHWPKYGNPVIDMEYRGFDYVFGMYYGFARWPIKKCHEARDKQLAHCKEMNSTTGLRLAIDNGSYFRDQPFATDRCGTRPTDVYIAHDVWKRSRTKWRDIPIPTHNYWHPGQPKSAAANDKRCKRAVHDAAFKGNKGNDEHGQERNLLWAFHTIPGFAIEMNTKYGSKSERMAALLHDSRFGLIPAGDGWHSYRLMETMAMGVVPIIMSDEWALPFEDILDWSEFSIRVWLDDIHRLPSIVAEHRDNACNMSRRVFEMYHRYMANATQIMKGIQESIQKAELMHVVAST